MSGHTYDRQCGCHACTNTEAYMTARAQSGYRAGRDLDPQAKPRQSPLILPRLAEHHR